MKAWKWFVASLMLVLLVTLLLGSVRYHGPRGLWRRVMVEVNARAARPHPALAPTPLPTPTPHPTFVARTSTPAILPALQYTPPAPAQTATPAVTATSTPTPTLTPTPALPPQVMLTGLRHNWQTWNNCGPATLAMHLSFFGSTLTQKDIRLALRPNDDDKNVSLSELAAYAQEQGFLARAMVNGDAQRIKALVAAGVPVLIETWFQPEPNNGMGHYRLVVGYDDEAGQWIVYDSIVSTGVEKDKPYQGIRLDYAETESLWHVFNRAYLVVYTPEQAAAVEAILGEDLDRERMWQAAMVRALAEIDADEEDTFAWFNLGSSYTALGRYDEAAAAFDRARILGLPWRMMWYQFAPFKAYYETGRYEELLALADATLATSDQIEEVHAWRGMALAALGRMEEAQAAFARAEALHPNHPDVARAFGQ